jgi:hypothetical protein
VRVRGGGKGLGQANGNEPVRAPDRIELQENATFELVGGCEGPCGLAGGGRAHGAHAEERKRAESDKKEDPTSHMQAIGCSKPTRDH